MSKRSIIAIIVIGILAVAIPLTIRLVQQQQIFKPKAEEGRSACFIDENKCVYIDYVGCDGDPHDGQHDHCWYDCAADECATPAGAVTTCKGEKTIAQLTSELQGAGYPGPWDTDSMVAAYNRAACPGSASVPSGTICENDPPGAVGVLSSKLQEQVHWVADCNKFCPNNDRPNRGGCPKNPATDFAVSRDDSAWCWGFDSSGTNRCLQLQPGRACTLDWFGNSNLSASCVSCIAGKRPDVEQHYRGPAGQVNCSTRRIINDWCTKVDPGGCNPIKSGQCANECGQPPPTNPDPVGTLDSAACDKIEGWTCDASDFSKPIDVHLYDGPGVTQANQIGITTANSSRADIASSCGGNANHAFSFTTPASLKDGQPHQIYAYGINIFNSTINAGNNPKLNGSPKTITCTSTGTGTISASPNPVPAGSGPGTTTITWSGVASTGQVRVYEPTGNAACSPTNQCTFGGGSSGSKALTTVENGHTYIFNLYNQGCTKADCSDQAVIDSVTVTRQTTATTQCFFVSETADQRDGLLSCGQSGAVPYTQHPQTVSNFQLSSGNGTKTLYIRFLKLAAGETITACTDPNKCKDSQHQITLSATTGCSCSTADTCASGCTFSRFDPPPTGVSYANPIRCGKLLAHPSEPDNKNAFCQRPERTKGDADNLPNSGCKVNWLDYLHYHRATTGGTLPLSINPDFNGDGAVGDADFAIWRLGRCDVTQ